MNSPRQNAIILASSCDISPRAVIEDDVTIVADELIIGDGALVASGSDIRAHRVVLGDHTEVRRGAAILVGEEFALGNASVLDRDANVTCRAITVGRESYLGWEFSVGFGSTMEETSTVVIGDACQIGPRVIFNATAPILVSHQVGVGGFTNIWTHGYHSGHRELDGYIGATAPVELADGCWLGVNTCVLPGVTVGRGSIVGSCSLVNRSVEPGTLVAGVPAVWRKNLTPAPVELERWTTRVAADWLRRLAFKGLDVATHVSGTAVITHRGRQWQVHVLAERGRIRLDSGEGSVAFHLDAQKVSGTLDELSHDLRDYLRRRSLLITYSTNSVGIVPEMFKRLLEADLGGTPEGAEASGVET